MCLSLGAWYSFLETVYSRLNWDDKGRVGGQKIWNLGLRHLWMLLLVLLCMCWSLGTLWVKVLLVPITYCYRLSKRFLLNAKSKFLSNFLQAFTKLKINSNYLPVSSNAWNPLILRFWQMKKCEFGKSKIQWMVRIGTEIEENSFWIH